MLLGCIAVILTVAGCAAPGKAPITEHFFNIEAQRGSLTNAALGKVTLGYGSFNLQFKWAGRQQDRYLLPALKSELQSANLFGADGPQTRSHRANLRRARAGT